MVRERRSASRRQVLGAGLAVASLAAPFVRAQAAAPIRIGLPIPLTGPYEQEALDMLRGAHVAVAMFNEQGGLNGQTAELLMRDDELDPGRAAEVTSALIAHDKVDFVTGGLSGAVQLAINNVTKAAKVVFNSISQSDAIVALPDWSPYTFHEALTPHTTSQAVGRYVFSRYGKRVAFLAADYAYGAEMVRGFEEIGRQFGIQVVATERHPLGAPDFATYLENIRAAKPDILVFCNFGVDQQLSVQQAGWIGLKPSMQFVAPILVFDARLDAGAEAYQGMLGGTSYYWRLEDTIPTAATFNRRFRAFTEGRVPSDYGALGFAGVMTVLTAARAAGSVASDKLVEALQGMKFDLYKGPEYYRPCDHQAVQSMLIIDSRFTDKPNDLDVFNIVEIVRPDEALLADCASLGHR
ncbi:MAG TPA: ABC transporter substrate-binding protein [Acetobacteraceae bacterium]|nr:ABC transporter substrate-binding protein [Acetobacteraceae bacterium]